MANIHRIGDYQNSNNSNNGPGGNYYSMGMRNNQAGSGMGMPFMGGAGSGAVKDPRQENFWDMLRNSCCPSLKIHSFIAIITIIDIIVFITTLAYGGLDIPNANFLPPQCWVLLDFGNKYPYAEKYQYQLWRFVTPVFLHANFLHILFNMFSQLVVGTLISSFIGERLLIQIYFLCAVGGNLFSSLVDDSFSVGASTAIAGMLGLYIAFVIVNWESLPSQLRCLMCCMITMVIFINLTFSMGNSTYLNPSESESESEQPIPGQGTQVDNWGHLGGILTGVFAGMAFIKPQAIHGTYEKNVKLIGFLLLVGGLLGGMTGFFVARHPSQQYC